jgi:hypothetical protein
MCNEDSSKVGKQGNTWDSGNTRDNAIGDNSKLTPKGKRVFLLKTASKEPLLKARQIVQNWNQFWYFQP